MTYVSAEAGDGGIFMRSDIAMTVYDDSGEIAKQIPLPKMTILDPSFVVGLAGDDPVGGLKNIFAMRDDCPDSDSLMATIEDDGDRLRQYILLTAEGDVWKFIGGRWQGPRPFGWIGSQQAKQLHDPDPFRDSSRQDTAEAREAHAAWARSQGFSDCDIEYLISGEAEKEIGPEMAQLNAMRTAGPDVSAFMIEARLVNGQFRFSRQSIFKVFGSPVLSEDDHLLRALLGKTIGVSHFTESADDGFPASLAIEFLGALITFMPCRNLGYSHRISYLSPENQKALAFD